MTFACIIPAMFLSEFELAPNIVITSLFYLNMIRLNKFDTIEQGQKTVQELIQELTKYAAQMMQYLDDHLFRRRLIAALRPSL